MRIFVLGLPHTVTSPKFSSCAYTMKVWNLCRMMKDVATRLFISVTKHHIPSAMKTSRSRQYEEWSRVYEHPGTDFFDISC